MIEKFFSNLKFISNAGLLLLIFLLPWQTRWIAQQGIINGNPSEYLTVSLYATDILLVLLIINMLICAYAGNSIFRNFKFLKQKPLVLLGAGLIIWSALSIFWSGNRTLAGQRVFWLLLAVGLAWLVTKYENKARLIFWFVMGLMVSSWLGIWQFVAQNYFANKWLGLAANDPQAGGTSIVEIYTSAGEPIRWLRAYGTFDHPNIFGMAMTIGIILTIAELTRTKYGQKYNDIVLYFALASMSAGLFASLSRSAWLGLALGVIVVLIFLLRSLLRSKVSTEVSIKVSTFSKPLATIAVTFAIMASSYPSQFLIRSGGSGRLETKSIDDRAAYFEQGKETISENPALGVGAGNYVANLSENKSADPAWIYQPVHNVPMLIWAETGIIGILGAVAFFAALWLYAWRSRNILGLTLWASLIPALLFDHWLWDLHFGVLLIGFAVGLVFNLKQFNNVTV